jgi:lipopolysaccharide export system protein LptC
VSTTRVIIIVLAVAALVMVAFAAGWTDDKAKPGTTGRVPVTAPATK